MYHKDLIDYGRSVTGRCSSFRLLSLSISAPRSFDARGMMYALAARTERREAAESSSEEQQAAEALPSYENATNTECRHQRVREPGYRAELPTLPPHLDVRQGVVPCCPRHPLHGDLWDNDETLCVRKAEELAQVLPTPGFIGVYPGIEDETSWDKFMEERRALSIQSTFVARSNRKRASTFSLIGCIDT